MEHNFYVTGDTDAPESIQDHLGYVVLSLCRVCGGAEGELTTNCPGKNLTRQQLEDVYMGVGILFVISG